MPDNGEKTYAYVFSSCASKEKPDTEITRLLEKAMRYERLTRQEKDRIAEILYGTFGSHGSAYRLAGWVWYMASYLNRILVRFEHDSEFYPYYAPDKTSLRRALYGKIAEMILT